MILSVLRLYVDVPELGSNGVDRLTWVISVEVFLKQLLKLSKNKIIPKLDKRLIRPQDIALQIADCKKFKKDTRWKPKISFNDSVKKLLDHCRQNL